MKMARVAAVASMTTRAAKKRALKRSSRLDKLLTSGSLAYAPKLTTRKTVLTKLRIARITK